MNLLEKLADMGLDADEQIRILALLAEDRRELVEAYDEYIEVLGKAISEFAGIAYVHGIRQSPGLVERGEQCRKRIAGLAKGGKL